MDKQQNEIQNDEVLISGLQRQEELIETLLEDIEQGSIDRALIRERIDSIRLNLRSLAGDRQAGICPLIMKFIF